MSRKAVAGSVAALTLLLGGAGALWFLQIHALRREGAPSVAKAARYHCPMHPTMVSDRPADCPICQMRMAPVDDGGRGEATSGSQAPSPSSARPATAIEPPATAPSATQPAATGLAPIADSSKAPGAPARKKILYRSSMNPLEVSDKPGKDSMGMEMVPEEAEAEAPAADAGAALGLSPVRISAQKRQLIGVKTSLVERSRFRRSIHAVGSVTFDETRLHHVHSKVSGYIEKLYANATGEFVRSGEPLLEIYSPELLASQQEYLIALKARERTAGSSLPSVAASGAELLASVRRRLELFDVSDEQIRELEASGRPRRTVTLHAPISGYIIERKVTHGEKVEPETTLLDLADLSRVWVMASIYEYQLPFVRKGQSATMTLSYVPGRTFAGRVSFVYPVLDPATRTAQVRLEFPNPDVVLKPDMYAKVSLEADLGDRLAVPATAVMETGSRSIVFVDKGEGYFEPREISVGIRLPDRYEALGGVAQGEKVVTSGNFFIDSESKIQAALEGMGGPGQP